MNNWPVWLKGGMILFLIQMISTIPTAGMYFYLEPSSIIALILSFIFGALLGLAYGTIKKSSKKMNWLIGAIIGLIMGIILSLLFVGHLTIGAFWYFNFREEIYYGLLGKILYIVKICATITHSENLLCLGTPLALLITILFVIFGIIIGGKLFNKQQPVQTQPQIQSK